MVLVKYEIDVILDLVFIILGPFLQIINADRLLLKFSNNCTCSSHIFQTHYRIILGVGTQCCTSWKLLIQILILVGKYV